MHDLGTDGDLETVPAAMLAGIEADVYVYSGILDPAADTPFIDKVASPTSDTAKLFLCTPGGSADTAYRIARALQASYKKFVLVVNGQCTSAGTLLATGAHELVMGPHAYFGPIDVQVLKDDELLVRSSGLTPTASLVELTQALRKSFRTLFLDIKLGGRLTTRTAADVAAQLCVGAYGPIFGQLDPIRIAEMSMAVRVATEYAKRLSNVGMNIGADAIAKLVSNYPSHSFVIDRTEASELFGAIREPEKAEQVLLDGFGDALRTPIDESNGILILRLKPEHPNAEHETADPSGTNGTSAPEP